MWWCMNRNHEPSPWKEEHGVDILGGDWTGLGMKCPLGAWQSGVRTDQIPQRPWTEVPFYDADRYDWKEVTVLCLGSLGFVAISPSRGPIPDIQSQLLGKSSCPQLTAGAWVLCATGAAPMTRPRLKNGWWLGSWEGLTITKMKPGNIDPGKPAAEVSQT